MDETVRWFLVQFDRFEGSTVVEDFSSQSEAFARYIHAERRPETRGQDPRLDIVLIGAESIEAVKLSYPQYFAEGSRNDRLDGVFAALAI